MANITELQNFTDGKIGIPPFLALQIDTFISRERRNAPAAYKDIEAHIQQASIGNVQPLLNAIAGSIHLAGFEPRIDIVDKWVLPKKAVLCNTIDLVRELFFILKAKGIRIKETPEYYYGKTKENTCFSLSNGFAYASKGHYESMGYEIFNADYFGIEPQPIAN